jgi:hypothetical protein
MKPVDKKKNPGLAKLPTAVRNKMGYMKEGGTVKEGEEKYSTMEFGKTYHPITQLQMSKNIRKNLKVIKNLQVQKN